MTDYKEKFEKMRLAGNLASRTLDMLTENIKEGISTDKIDSLGYEFIRDNGGFSAPLYYRGFKNSLCTSLNHVVCHGIPNKDRILRDGDALNVDVTAIINEHYGDTSRMFCIGKTSVKLNNLIDAINKSYKTYLIFLVQIQNMKYFKIAKDIDADYYKNYLLAKKAGVNFLAYRCNISSKKIFIDKKLKIIDD